MAYPLGPIDGCTACVGNWNYHFDICRNVQIPTAIGCTSGTTRTAYRIDEYATPSSRWCEYMGPDAQSSDGLLVSALTGNRQGLMLTYTYLSRNMRVNLICDRGASLSSVPEPVEMGGNVIEIDWRTPVTCNGAGNTGWLIVILTSTALGVCAPPLPSLPLRACASRCPRAESGRVRRRAGRCGLRALTKPWRRAHPSARRRLEAASWPLLRRGVLHAGQAVRHRLPVIPRAERQRWVQ